ncbi:MAG: hypothetical protein H0W78_11545 [Planctomycetes bacterium]|nr:hypothetical protein [Planctomycetota bacterium]
MRLSHPFLIAALAAATVINASEVGPHVPIPDWVIAGIAAVETGSTYRSGELVLYRNRRDGADGEVGPWQISPSVLQDLGVSHLLERIRSEPVLAESMTRAWLLRCYRRAGDWNVAVAIYHTGPAGDHRRGRDYAERVFAVGNLP